MSKSVFVCLLLISVFFTSCGIARKSANTTYDRETLSPQEQRKFDYLFLEATRLAQAGKSDESFDIMQQAAAIDTASAVAKYALAALYLQMNKPQPAYDLIKTASAEAPDNYWYGMMLANLASNLGDTDEAIIAYQNLISHNPKKPELNYMLADAYTKKGEYQNAIDAFNRMENSMGIMESITLQKVKLYKALNQPDMAYAEMNRLIAANPRNIGYMVLLGDLYLDDNKPDEALKMYNQAAEIEPDNGYLLMSKANYYNHIGNKEEFEKQIYTALLNDRVDVGMKLSILTDYLNLLLQKKEDIGKVDDLFAALLDMHPQEDGIHKLYADFLISQKRFSEAQEQMQIVVDLSPAVAGNWVQLMRITMFLEKYDDVIRIGENAIKYVPEIADIYLYWGGSYIMLKKYDEAIAIFQKGLENVGTERPTAIADLYGQIGDSYHAKGEPEKAYEMYEKALTYDPKNVGVLNNYSYYLSLEKKDLDKAERMSGETVKLEPDNATYLDTYGWIFFQQGNYSLAKLYLQSALSKDPEHSPELMEHYGDVMFMLGDADEALEYWQKAKEAGSESDVLLRKIKDKKYYEK